MRFLVYDDSIWGSNCVFIEIGYLWNSLGGHREVIVDTRKEILEELCAG